MPHRVAVQFGTRAGPLPAAARLRAWARAALRGEPGSYALCIRVVDGREGRALNRRYRHKDYATNVLSFESERLPFVPLTMLGDVVLCAPVVRAEARAQGKAPLAHWAHLTVHGVLHLLGMRHDSARASAAMERREVRILAELGYPDPYPR